MRCKESGVSPERFARLEGAVSLADFHRSRCCAAQQAASAAGWCIAGRKRHSSSAAARRPPEFGRAELRQQFGRDRSTIASRAASVASVTMQARPAEADHPQKARAQRTAAFATSSQSRFQNTNARNTPIHGFRGTFEDEIVRGVEPDGSRSFNMSASSKFRNHAIAHIPIRLSPAHPPSATSGGPRGGQPDHEIGR